MGIYLLRHIRTVYNLEHRLSGQSEAPVLHEEKLVLPAQPVHFDFIFCSPAQRCRATLRQLSESWDLSASRILFDSNLLERNLGALEGMKREDAIAQYPQLFQNGKLLINAVPPHGESMPDLIHRASGLLPQITEHSANCGNTLILSHNQMLKVLTALLCRTEITDEYWQTHNYQNGVLYPLGNISHLPAMSGSSHQNGN